MPVKRVHVEAMQFAFVAFVGLIFNAAFVFTLVEYTHLHYLLAQLIAGVFIALANFILYHLIFRDVENFSFRNVWRNELREPLALAGLLSLFVAIRLPGLHLPFHQDEGKIAEIVHFHMVGGLSGHPPLTELIYRWSGYFIEASELRLVPLAFGVISAILLYLVVRKRAGVPAAYTAAALYAISAYGVLASLMVDTDGAILPTLFLAAVYAYDRFRDAPSRRASIQWLCAAALAIVLGFLVKLSFVLVVGALVLDYLIEMREKLTRTLLLRAAFVALAAAGVGLLAVFSARVFLPAFDVSQTIAHALSYVRFEGRGYLQILIQGMKALFYLSPLLLAPLVFLSKDTLVKNRIFAVYVGLGAFFYFVLFDFSQGALDKYLMYTVVPLSAIAGTILAGAMRGVSTRSVLLGLTAGLLGALALVHLNFLSPQVMPLYPKTAWLSAIAAGNWNILIPFTGGSGPLGFYVSFLVITVGFACAGILVTLARIIPSTKGAALTALIVLGATSSAIFTEELIYGRINGSAPETLRAGLEYVAQNSVKSVITHADAGGYELKVMGKYAGRFYAVPGYEEGHRVLFSKHTGQYLVVDMPHLNENGFYSKFFSTCEVAFATSSGVITAHVYYCPHSDPFAIK